MEKVRRVACINDLCGFGRCSLTTAIPILSVIGVQPCPIPTAVLSKHTGFQSYTFTDLSDNMSDFIKSLSDIAFDGIYSGFLGSADQIKMVQRLMKNHPDAVKIIDPVMGDHGRIYSTYTQGMCEGMKRLASMADIVTPNITEACILASEAYENENISDNKAAELAEKIISLGAKTVVITGISDGSTMTNLTYKRDGSTAKSSFKRTDMTFSGTGDIFASVLCGYVIKGMDVPSAAQKAGSFVASATRITLESGADTENGVEFERCLNLLMG